MGDELKPCPLCGSEAILIPADDESPAEVYCSCYCSCGCSIIKSETAGTIAAWNARAERTCRVEWRDDDWGVCECGGDVYKGDVYCSSCGAKVAA